MAVVVRALCLVFDCYDSNRGDYEYHIPIWHGYLTGYRGSLCRESMFRKGLWYYVNLYIKEISCSPSQLQL